MIDVALATDGATLDLSPDDQLLRSALGERGLSTVATPWTHEGYDWTRVRACIPRLRAQPPSAGAARDYDDWLGRVHELTRLVNPLATIRWNLRESYLAELARRGVPTVEYACFERGARVDIAAELDRREAAVVRLGPAHRHAGARAAFARGEAREAQRRLVRMLAEGDVVLAFDAPAPRRRSCSLVFLEGGFSHAVTACAGSAPTGEAADFLDAALPREDEIAVAQAALDGLPAPAVYARVDLVRGAQDEALLSALDVVDGPLHFAWGEGSAERLAGAIFARLARDD